MKLLYLLKYQYSNFFLKELALMVLSGFIIITLLGSAAPLLYVLSMSEMTKNSIPEFTLYFYPSTRISDLMASPVNQTNNREGIADYLDQLNQINGVVGIGKTATWSVGGKNPEVQPTTYIAYNEDMVRYTSIPLYAGQWLNAPVPEGRIPIVVGGTFREKDAVNIGDNLPVQIQIDNSYYAYEGYVVGIMNHDDMYLRLSYGATKPDLESIAVQKRWADNSSSSSAGGIIIFPASALDESIQIQYNPGSLLFFDELSSYKDMGTGEKYGTYATHAEMVRSQMVTTIRRHNSDIAATIALSLLATISLGGYSMLNISTQRRMISVYRICGMKKSTGMLLQITSSSVLVLIPALISISQIPRYTVDFARLDGRFFMVYGILLLTVILPSVIYIIVYNSSQSAIIYKEEI